MFENHPNDRKTIQYYRSYYSYEFVFLRIISCMYFVLCPPNTKPLYTHIHTRRRQGVLVFHDYVNDT